MKLKTSFSILCLLVFILSSCTQQDVIENTPKEKLLLNEASHGDTEKVISLINSGVNVNAKGVNDMTPLYIASSNGQLETAQVLIRAGADVNAKSKYGAQPIHIASEYGRAKVVKFLLANGAQIDAKTENGGQPIHMAAMAGQTEIVSLLIQKGANPSACTNDGEQPIYTAASVGSIDVIEELLLNDVSVKLIDRHGRTLIHAAACIDDEKKAISTVRFLLDLGVKASVKDKRGNRASDFAKYKGHSDLAAYLKEQEERELLSEAIQPSNTEKINPKTP